MSDQSAAPSPVSDLARERTSPKASPHELRPAREPPPPPPLVAQEPKTEKSPAFLKIEELAEITRIQINDKTDVNQKAEEQDVVSISHVEDRSSATSETVPTANNQEPGVVERTPELIEPLGNTEGKKEESPPPEQSPQRRIQADLSRQKALIRVEKDRIREERDKLKVDQEGFYARIQSARSAIQLEYKAELKTEHEQVALERERIEKERLLFMAEQEELKSLLKKEQEEVAKLRADAKSMWERAESVFMCQSDEKGLTAGAREMWNRADAARADIEAKIRILEEQELLAQLREDKAKKEAEAKDLAEQKAREDKEVIDQKAKEIRDQMEGSKIDLNFRASCLPTMDMTSKSDPFLVVFIQDPTDLSFTELGRTEPIIDDEDPAWTKSVMLPLDPKHNRDPVLRLMVFDEDCSDSDLSKHDFIGETFLKLSTILAHADDRKGFPLKNLNAPVMKKDQPSLLFIMPKENEAHSQDKKKQVARKKVAEEIVSTERSYLSGLFAMGTHFGTPAQALLSREDYDTLFGGSSMLAAVNKAFFADVETRVAHWDDLHTTIGDLFVTFAPYFKLYTSYVNNHAKADLLTKTLLLRNKAFKAMCEKGTEASGNTLQSFLILPIQRIPRYVLLLTELLKNTPDTHPDFHEITEAIPHVKNVATFVNKAMSGAGLAEELLAIQHSFDSSCPDLLAPGRSLVHRAPLIRVDLEKGGSLKKYDFLLMSDIILFAKPSSSLMSDDQRKLSGLITIDDHFYVQDIDLSVDIDHPNQEHKEVKEPSFVRQETDTPNNPSPRMSAGTPRRDLFTKTKSSLNLLPSSKPAFRIISHKAISVWIAESPEDKAKWLELFQKVATARMKVIEFKNRTGDMLYDGLPFNHVQRDLDPQPSTLLFLRHEKDSGRGWIHARVWYEERAQLVHVMLVEARDLPSADVNGFSDPYCTLSYYSLVELEAISYHHNTHRGGKALMSLASRKNAEMLAEMPKAVQKLKPRWKAKSKVVKKNLNPWWGQHFSFAMSSAERISRNKNLLVIEVFDWDQIGSDDILGQCTFDLSYIPAFSNPSSAPPMYTKMPDARKEAPDVHDETSPSMLRRWSLVQSKRNLDPTAHQDESIFFNLIHSQTGLGGEKGRFYWVNKGSILLQKSQSFTTSEVFSIETGSVPAYMNDALPLTEKARFIIITAEEEGDDRAPLTDQLRVNGKITLVIQTETANAVREWCCQLTQVLPMVRVIDKAGTLIRPSSRQVISTASSAASVACDHFEKHLFRKRDLCRTCGLTRDEHAPEHRGKRATVSVLPTALKVEPSKFAKSASQSMTLALPSQSEESKLQRQERERS